MMLQLKGPEPQLKIRHPSHHFNLFGRLFWVAMTLIGCRSFSAQAEDIQTNAVKLRSPPSWVRAVDVRRITAKIEAKLEWSTRRTEVYWYATPEAFAAIHNYGSAPLAVTTSSPTASVVHLGPKVTPENFAVVFGHELVHVIINQKYRGAVPKWLEEGLANHLAKAKPVDYKWLAKFPLPQDVYELSHPLHGSSENVLYRYKASQALIEMLAKKCDLENLLRLSVQRKMEDYIKTYCEISDLNQAYQAWVKKMSTQAAPRSP